MGQVALSFVVPAYNEEDFIEDTLGSLEAVIKGKNLPYEIVVVDDGSLDGTLAKVIRYAKTNGHVKVVSYANNIGKGHAVKTGFMQTSGDIVVFADSDMEIGLSTISCYLAALERGDIVIASKRHADSRVEVPLSRRILSLCFNGLVRLLTGVPVNDTQSGLKAMRKSAFIDIFPRLAVKRYAFDVELLAVAHLCGLKVVEMPVDIKLDAAFKPKEMWHMFVDLLGITYRLRVLHWYQRLLPEKNGFQNMVSFVLREP
ncbi:MAG: glycosyltransferase [Candidatus Bathyarchaeia archaeon]|jgi:glycosyltransferase involved in cell wall biosynthesis